MKFAKDIPGGKIMLALIFCFFISCGIHSPKNVTYNKPLEEILPFISSVTNDTVKKDTTIVLKEKTVIAPKNSIPELTTISQNVDNNTLQTLKMSELINKLDSAVKEQGNTNAHSQHREAVKDSLIIALSKRIDALNLTLKDKQAEIVVKDTINKSAKVTYNVFIVSAGLALFLLGYFTRVAEERNRSMSQSLQ